MTVVTSDHALALANRLSYSGVDNGIENDHHNPWDLQSKQSMLCSRIAQAHQKQDKSAEVESIDDFICCVLSHRRTCSCCELEPEGQAKNNAAGKSV